MVTLEDEKQQRERLAAALDKLSQIDAKSLVRKDELGAQLCFEDGLPYFQRTLTLFSDLSALPLDSLSYTDMSELTAVAEKALNEFTIISKFSVETYPENTIGRRNQLIVNFSNQYNQYHKIVAPRLAYLVAKEMDIGALKAKADDIVQDLEQSIAEHMHKLQERESKADGILESMRKAAGEAGVSAHAFHFAEEAKAQAKGASGWLVVTVAVALATLLFAGYTIHFYAQEAESLSIQHSIQIGIAKLIAFSVFYFGLIWSGRNYRAQRHNYVVNKHRQNALSTFDAFVKAAGDEATKDAVLLRATEAIFTPGASGYITGESEPQGTSHILEVLRQVADKPG